MGNAVGVVALIAIVVCIKLTLFLGGVCVSMCAARRVHTEVVDHAAVDQAAPNEDDKLTTGRSEANDDRATASSDGDGTETDEHVGML